MPENPMSKNSVGSVYIIIGTVVVILICISLWYILVRKATNTTPAPASVVSTLPPTVAPAAAVATPPPTIAPAAAVATPPPTSAPRAVVNVLPSQNEPPINYVFPGDKTSPIGWKFSTSGTFRVFDGDTVWGRGLRTPDGAATYNVLQLGASYMQATLTNLQIGATYQIRGYAACRPNYPVGSKFDINLLTSPAQILKSITLQTFTFDPFGPVDFVATAATHVLEFHGRGGDVLLSGLSVVMK
jgi:hypothetical protein